MTEQPDPDTQELEPLDVHDESVDQAHPVLTPDEEAEGQQLGEEIDTEDDEDSGIGEPDKLRPAERVSPYLDGEVVQDVYEPA